MKPIKSNPTNKAFRLLCLLMLSLLFGSATARADVVLDWNEIAVNTAIANGQNPFAQARYGAVQSAEPNSGREKCRRCGNRARRQSRIRRCRG